MKTQQQAETEEKQRIKSLVLNYDLTSENDTDGKYYNFSLPPIERNHNKQHLYRSNIGQEREQKVLQSARSSTDTNTLARHLRSLRQSSMSNSISKKPSPSKTENSTFAYNNQQGIEKQPQNPYSAPRVDKAGTSARMQRGRKLQLSDMDWYEQQNFLSKDNDYKDAVNGAERQENTPFGS
jgi:hypothetical protein